MNFGSSIDQVAQAFAAYWQEIGVDIKPTQLEHAVFTADFRDLKWDMMIATNPTYTEDADYTLGRLYSSPNGVNEENGYVNSEAARAPHGGASGGRPGEARGALRPGRWHHLERGRRHLPGGVAERLCKPQHRLGPRACADDGAAPADRHDQVSCVAAQAMTQTMTESTLPALSVEGLSVAVGATEPRLRLVEDVSLRCDPASVTAVIGESGSGKSITASAVLGLLDRRVYHVTARDLSVGGSRTDGAGRSGLRPRPWPARAATSCRTRRPRSIRP